MDFMMQAAAQQSNAAQQLADLLHCVPNKRPIL